VTATDPDADESKGEDESEGKKETEREGPLVLKLGGSVVTEKGDPETVDRAALGDAAGALADYPGDMVLVHGGGSFGHPAAERHGVTTETGTASAAAARDVHGAMKRLNAAVVDALDAAGVAALPVHPLSAAHRDPSGALSLATGPVAAMLGGGFTPVLHGDGVVRRGRGITVLSGDELVVALAGALGASRVGVCSTVPGVLDADGEVLPSIESFADAADALGDSEETDVTGGMAGKVQALLDLDPPAAVFGPGALSAFLAGERVGTRVG
jgi:isopentenyl phosphate kinase